MIKVYFPQGCYGSYVARCIYNFTNLRTTSFEDFVFDFNGSSHVFWNQRGKFSHHVQYGHLNTADVDFDDRSGKAVVILPDKNHRLDYLMNNFFKNEREQFVSYISMLLSETEICNKLQTNWNYYGDLETVPRWIMREWCSFWLDSFLEQSYKLEDYNNIDGVIKISTNDIVDNWSTLFYQICNTLELTCTVDKKIVKKQHDQFTRLQKFHNIQLRCEQYVERTLNEIHADITTHSIFDEAYVQYLLRQHRVEIYCDGLNQFPTSTQQLKSIVHAV
jgi:hypothetical protein